MSFAIDRVTVFVQEAQWCARIRLKVDVHGREGTTVPRTLRHETLDESSDVLNGVVSDHTSEDERSVVVVNGDGRYATTMLMSSTRSLAVTACDVVMVSQTEFHGILIVQSEWVSGWIPALPLGRLSRNANIVIASIQSLLPHV